MDAGSGGPENDFTNRNTTFLVWNCLHLARTLKDAGGIPAKGNHPDAWEAGCKTDFHSAEHRRQIQQTLSTITSGLSPDTAP